MENNDLKELDCTFIETIEQGLRSIPDSHSEKGRLHAQIADAYTNTLCQIVQVKNLGYLSDEACSIILRFLSHCAAARYYGLPDECIPCILEERILLSLVNYYQGNDFSFPKELTSPRFSSWHNLIKRMIKMWALNYPSSFPFKRTPDFNPKIQFIDVGASLCVDEPARSQDAESVHSRVVILNYSPALLEESALGSIEDTVLSRAPGAVVLHDSRNSIFSSLSVPCQQGLMIVLFEELKNELVLVRNDYRSFSISLQSAKKKAEMLFSGFIERYACSNEILLHLFSFLKDDPCCDFIHKQRHQTLDRYRVYLFSCKFWKERDLTGESNQCQRWWNTGTFSRIVQNIKSKLRHNQSIPEKKDRTVDVSCVSQFDYGNLVSRR